MTSVRFIEHLPRALGVKGTSVKRTSICFSTLTSVLFCILLPAPTSQMLEDPTVWFSVFLSSPLLISRSGVGIFFFFSVNVQTVNIFGRLQAT